MGYGKDSLQYVVRRADYGINLSNNSRGLLEKYRIDKMLDGLQAD